MNMKKVQYIKVESNDKLVFQNIKI